MGTLEGEGGRGLFFLKSGLIRALRAPYPSPTP